MEYHKPDTSDVKEERFIEIRNKVNAFSIHPLRGLNYSIMIFLL